MMLPPECNDTFWRSIPQDGQLYCPPIYDTIRCWDYTLAGTTAIGDCPPKHPHSKAFSKNGYSFKYCTKNGTWWTHPLSGRPWTNYSTCITPKKIEETHTVIYVYFSGFAVSVILLVVSLVIFSIFRQLKCIRVSLHKHLFVSYILSCISWIIWYKLVTLDVDVTRENPLWCRILHVFTQYVTICNYSWMMCEGLYLQAIIALTFTNQERIYIICCCIGWGFPLIPISVYTILRATDAPPIAVQDCWMAKTTSMWILMGPIIFSLLLNVIILINILRILLAKLRAVNTGESYQYRRTARACLILIPLLGVQYVIMPLQPEGETYIYNIITAILNSYQGALVSLLFCFFNGEVVQCVKRFIGNYRGSHSVISNSSMVEKKRSSFKRSSNYSVIPVNDIQAIHCHKKDMLKQDSIKL